MYYHHYYNGDKYNNAGNVLAFRTYVTLVITTFYYKGSTMPGVVLSLLLYIILIIQGNKP